MPVESYQTPTSLFEGEDEGAELREEGVRNIKVGSLRSGADRSAVSARRCGVRCQYGGVGCCIGRAMTHELVIATRKESIISQLVQRIVVT